MAIQIMVLYCCVLLFYTVSAVDVNLICSFFSLYFLVLQTIIIFHVSTIALHNTASAFISSKTYFQYSPIIFHNIGVLIHCHWVSLIHTLVAGFLLFWIYLLFILLNSFALHWYISVLSWYLLVYQLSLLIWLELFTQSLLLSRFVNVTFKVILLFPRFYFSYCYWYYILS